MTVKLLIIYPMDPLGPKVGGAETFLKGFIKNAPGDNENFFFARLFGIIGVLIFQNTICEPKFKFPWTKKVCKNGKIIKDNNAW